MSEDTRCNGWTNYATWRVNLELIDDYASSLVDDDQKWDSVSDLADHLSEYADEAMTGFGGYSERDQEPFSLAVSYARAFLSDVNWYEIAEHWTDELVSSDEDEDETEDEGDQ